jgi:hypothetical protein
MFLLFTHPASLLLLQNLPCMFIPSGLVDILGKLPSCSFIPSCAFIRYVDRGKYIVHLPFADYIFLNFIFDDRQYNLTACQKSFELPWHELLSPVLLNINHYHRCLFFGLSLNCCCLV